METSEGASTGDPDARLDLGAWEPWTAGESTGGSSGGEESTVGDFPTTGSSSGAAGESTGGESTGDESTGSTGAGSTSGSSTSETSTGGDSSTGEPLTDCPCEDGADNVCDLAPGTCSATMPGGYCDPDGDGAYFDGDFNLGWTEYQAKCG